MQSVTSCFNRALFRKNLLRFWPLLILYTLIWCFILPLPLLSKLSAYSHSFVPDVWDIGGEVLAVGSYLGVVMALAFGILFAMAMFSYLTNPRATQGFHAMPVRRETLYITNYLSGLCCMLSGLLITFAATGLILAFSGNLFRFSFLTESFAAAALSIVFFYSFAVFCMIFTGQLLAAPVFYAVLNFLATALEILVRNFAGKFLYGYSSGFSDLHFVPFSPFLMIMRSIDIERVYDDLSPNSMPSYWSAVTGVHIEDFSLFLLYALVGIVFAALGLLVYRRRLSEASGSTVAISWARPIFRYGVAFCSALTFGQLIYYLLFGSRMSGQGSLPGVIGCMVFTGLLGYFTAEMLLKKRFRITRSAWIGAGCVSAVLILLGVIMSFDLVGYEGYVPDDDEIESVNVNLWSYGDHHESFYGYLTDGESIHALTELHRAVIRDKARQYSTFYDYDYLDRETEGTLDLRLTYSLKNGTLVHRNYYDLYICAQEQADPASLVLSAEAFLNSSEALYKRIFDADLPADAYTLTGGTCSIWNEREGLPALERTLSAAQIRAVYAAVLDDCAHGRLDAALFRASAEDYPLGEVEFYYVLSSGTSPASSAVQTNTSASSSSVRNNYAQIRLTDAMQSTLAALRAIYAVPEAAS